MKALHMMIFCGNSIYFFLSTKMGLIPERVRGESFKHLHTPHWMRRFVAARECGAAASEA